MRKVTRQLITDFKIEELGFDFMGYEVVDLDDLSFHHVLIPRRLSNIYQLARGLYYWNGVILNKPTSHTYLHLVEEYNLDMYLAITSELIDEKIKGYIDMENLRYIDGVLDSFEREYSGIERNGKPLIQEEYLKRVLKKNI